MTRSFDSSADCSSLQKIQELQERNLLLEAALGYMSQGHCMFDAAGRLVFWNKRFEEIYKLQGRLQIGFTLPDILRERLEMGTIGEDPDVYARRAQAAARAGQAFRHVFELPDGRSIAVTNEARPTGGWVSTHDDITEQRKAAKAVAAARAEAERAEKEARIAHARLLDAFEVVPEGLVLFDAEDRYVLWNRRYAELFSPDDMPLVEGLRYEDLLRAELARGRYPDAQGREEEWLTERLAQHAQPLNSREYRLPDDRWVRIEERRTADGGSVGVRIDISELKRREASFRLLFDGNPVPMWVYDAATMRFLAVNDAAVEHYGYSREQFLAMTILDIRPAKDREAVRRLAVTQKYSSETTWRHVKADGTQIDVAIFARSLSYQGHAAGICAIFDLTDRNRAEEEVRRTRTFLDTIIDNVPSNIVVKELPSLRYLLVNRAGEKHFSLPREKMIGKTAHDIFPKTTADLIHQHDVDVLQSGEEKIFGEHSIMTPSGNTHIVATARLPIMDAEGKPQYLISVIDDLTQRKRDEARIAHMAHHDPLTDLPNRTAFNECLEATLAQAAAAGEKFAVLCVDLDRFKEVNDVFGHAVGDALLCQVARRLEQACEGAFLARLGGDEFIVISAAGPQPAGAEAVAERVHAALAGNIEIEGQLLRADLTIGVSIYPNDGDNPETLMANADAALYRAKAEARGSIRFFEQDMDRRLREKRALQHDLRSAVDRNELELYYQPQALIDGVVTGFEALVRWHHPSRGLVSPDAFIPLAEESGLIISLGEWILRTACREAASWPRPLQIAINLSPVQFQHGDLPGLVHSALLESGLSAGRLDLEITEGVLVRDFSRAVSILRRLKSLGVHIAMDDFGTGYSSLSYLQAFPFDKIKIDQAFIMNLNHNPQSAAIIRAVIGLGRGLDLPVVAEGVETAEQLDFLSKESCNQIQGYLIGRPQPIDEYAEMVGRPATPAARSRTAVSA